MTGEDAVTVMVGILESSEIPYMLVGSFSSNYFGISRATRDADFVIHASREGRSALEAALPEGFDLDAQMSFEMVTSTTKQVVRIQSIPFEIELFDLSRDEFDQERFARRRKVRSGTRDYFLPTAEDVIVQKLRWCRNGRRTKDYEDARDVTAVQGRALDFDYIRAWTDRHETRDIFEEICASLKPVL